MKVDKTIKQESLYLLVGVIILSAIMEAVFLICSTFDYTVILGNLLGGGFAVLNFFLMGLTLQKSLVDDDSQMAKNRVKMSQSLRFLMLVCVAILGGILPCFNLIAVIVPFFFPRIVLTIRGLKIKNSPVSKANDIDEKKAEDSLSPTDEGGDNE